MIRSFDGFAGPTIIPALVALAMVGALIGGAAVLFDDRALIIEDVTTGERLLAVPVEDDSTVIIEYTHSVEKSRVLDVYEVDGDRLEMVRMEFQSSGWGLPATADVEIANGTFVARPDWSGAELYVAPGRIAGHRIHVDERNYDLVGRSEGASVRITVIRRSLLRSALDRLDG